MLDDDALPRMLGGRYRLEARLGQGGMGVVYRATDLHMQRPVAVKLIRGVADVEIDDVVAGRFLREAQHTARLRHEHIVEVFDLGREDGELFFVMELLHGTSLSAHIRKAGRLPAATGVHVGVQICEALHVAHVFGIVHRDLKPANVMLVARAGDEHYVKVLDFGVAKSMSADGETQLTRTGMLVGTVEYMAPEQIAGRKVDARTDVYAFGALLYKALTASAVFPGAAAPALIHAHLNKAPEPMRARAPDHGIPEALDHVVLRCLAKAPGDRFASMKDVAAALRASLEAPARAAASAPAPAPLDAPLAALPSFEYEEVEDGLGSWDKTRVAPPTFDDVVTETEAPVEETATRLRADPSRAPSRQPWVDDAAPTRVARPSTEPVRCAMCRTTNPVGARACVACGVSLASADQAALAARTYVPPPSAPPRSYAAPLPSQTAQTPVSAPSSVWGRVLARLLGRG